MDIDSGVYQSPNKLTMGDWLDIWTGEYMGDKKYLTVKNYKAVVDNHIKPALGAVKLMKLTAPAIQKFYNDLLNHGQLIPTRDEQVKAFLQAAELDPLGSLLIVIFSQACGNLRPLG